MLNEIQVVAYRKYLEGDTKPMFSTDFAGNTTAGFGKLDEYGFFEYPLMVNEETGTIVNVPALMSKDFRSAMYMGYLINESLRLEGLPTISRAHQMIDYTFGYMCLEIPAKSYFNNEVTNKILSFLTQSYPDFNVIEVLPLYRPIPKGFSRNYE